MALRSIDEHPVDDAPTDGSSYVRRDGDWSELPVTNDAPTDGLAYAREDGTWTKIYAGTRAVASGTTSGVVTLATIAYPTNTEPDEYDITVLMHAAADKGKGGILRLFGSACRGAGSVSCDFTVVGADSVLRRQDISLVSSSGDLLIRLDAGGTSINYRALIRRRRWSELV